MVVGADAAGLRSDRHRPEGDGRMMSPTHPATTRCCKRFPAERRLSSCTPSGTVEGEPPPAEPRCRRHDAGRLPSYGRKQATLTTCKYHCSQEGYERGDYLAEKRLETPGADRPSYATWLRNSMRPTGAQRMCSNPRADRQWRHESLSRASTALIARVVRQTPLPPRSRHSKSRRLTSVAPLRRSAHRAATRDHTTTLSIQPPRC